MSYMFKHAQVFDQNLIKWNTGNVINMKEMFRDTQAFSNHDLSSWNVNKVTEHTDFFTGADAGNTEPNWP
jgi:surface protein